MTDVTIATATADDLPTRQELLDLYESVGWTAYTRDPERLMRGVVNSTWVLSARDETGRLVGLLRMVSDRETIAYVQDLLVSPAAQRRQIGSRLMAEAQRLTTDIRQFVLISDNQPEQNAFYASVGLIEIHDDTAGPGTCFIRPGSLMVGE